jgi:archaellum component FlaC
VIKWNIDLVKQNSSLKKENRELKAVITQIENLVTSANDNLIQNKNSLVDIKEETEESEKTDKKQENASIGEVTKHTPSHHESIKDQVNKFILEMTNLQKEIQNQKSYAQKIEEELRRLKTLSYYYPMGNENVI